MFDMENVDLNNAISYSCDSGFGHELVKRLDSKGFHVFATCLFPSGPGALELQKSCSSKLQILHLDVTQAESVKKAAIYVKENLGSSEMWAVVNNAGILKGFSLEFSTMDDFENCINVNFLGMVRVTKEFVPLLKKAKGRVVNITSIVGEVPSPFMAPYASSKYAAVGFTDCIRPELDMWGVSVVSIEPETFKTGLTAAETINSMADSALKNMGTSVIKEYGEDYIESFKRLRSYCFYLCSDKISLVIDDLVSAVTLKHPKLTYKPRINILRRFFCLCYEVMPRETQEEIHSVKLVSRDGVMVF
ncbi:unnamed protein product [Larinioides sclopetarius]|uniref:Estradiol 17-beta-dehydrogenase 2 n=1 Tax=Larinioides sclopetarius TaxID=280406 RepID=A0AAV1ZT35_9ARAC